MSKKKSPPLLSENISAFLNLQTQILKDFEWNQEQLNKLDKMTQDYLHKLELENLSYKEKAKIAVILSRIRKQRRQHKDSLEILKPLHYYVTTDKAKQNRNTLSEILGQTRKAENQLGDKKYWFRVLQEPPIVDKSE